MWATCMAVLGIAGGGEGSLSPPLVARRPAAYPGPGDGRPGRRAGWAQAGRKEGRKEGSKEGRKEGSVGRAGKVQELGSGLLCVTGRKGRIGANPLHGKEGSWWKDWGGRKESGEGSAGGGRGKEEEVLA